MINISDVTELPAEELASILKQGTILRLPYLESRLLRAQEQVERFEEKHKTTLETLESQGLPDDAGYELHWQTFRIINTLESKPSGTPRTKYAWRM